MTPAETELPMRPRERHDGPTPSGAHLASLTALALARHKHDDAYASLAERTLEPSMTLALQAPLAMGAGLKAMVRLLQLRG